MTSMTQSSYMNYAEFGDTGQFIEVGILNYVQRLGGIFDVIIIVMIQLSNSS